MITTLLPKINKVVLIGYSGHALVVAESLIQSGYEIVGYLEKEMVGNNLLNIPYLGFENDSSVLEKIKDLLAFPAIGDNHIRERVMTLLKKNRIKIPKAIHPNAIISNQIKLGIGTLICRGACINPFSTIGRGVIINTGAIVEHECSIHNYVHIAPGAVLAGNVTVGNGSFIGANAVVKQGLTIGKNVIIGAGSVVLNDVQNDTVVIGNPAKEMKR